MFKIITIYITDTDINNNVLFIIIKHSLFFVLFFALTNKMNSSTYDKITRCTANDMILVNNGFIVYSVDIIALTVKIYYISYFSM